MGSSDCSCCCRTALCPKRMARHNDMGFSVFRTDCSCLHRLSQNGRRALGCQATGAASEPRVITFAIRQPSTAAQRARSARRPRLTAPRRRRRRTCCLPATQWPEWRLEGRDKLEFSGGQLDGLCGIWTFGPVLHGSEVWRKRSWRERSTLLLGQPRSEVGRQETRQTAASTSLEEAAENLRA